MNDVVGRVCRDAVYPRRKISTATMSCIPASRTIPICRNAIFPLYLFMSRHFTVKTFIFPHLNHKRTPFGFLPFTQKFFIRPIPEISSLFPIFGCRYPLVYIHSKHFRDTQYQINPFIKKIILLSRSIFFSFGSHIAWYSCSLLPWTISMSSPTSQSSRV